MPSVATTWRAGRVVPIHQSPQHHCRIVVTRRAKPFTSPERAHDGDRPHADRLHACRRLDDVRGAGIGPQLSLIAFAGYDGNHYAYFTLQGPDRDDAATNAIATRASSKI